MNIGLFILGYGVGVFLISVLLYVPDVFRWIADKFKERKQCKEAEIRWQARLEKYKANGGWLPKNE